MNLNIINWEIENYSSLFFFKFLLIIFLFITLSRYVNQTSLLSIIIILIIIYYFYQISKNQYQNNLNIQQTEDKYLNLKKYQYLQKYPNLLFIINNISLLSMFNASIFNKILFRLDNFLHIYYQYENVIESKRNSNILNLFEQSRLTIDFKSLLIENKVNFIDQAILIYQTLLNDLMSLYITFPLNHQVGFEHPIEKTFQTYFQQLKDILDSYIKNMKKINKLSNLNIYSKIYNLESNSPEDNPSNQKKCNFHWSLY